MDTVITKRMNLKILTFRWSRPNKSDVRTQSEALEVTKQVQELENNVEQFERSKVDNLRVWLQVGEVGFLLRHVTNNGYFMINE